MTIIGALELRESRKSIGDYNYRLKIKMFL